jgi:DNA-binding beta-propeller fold protein YncE
MDTGNASSAPGTASGMSTLVINGALTIPAFLFGNGVQGRAFSQSIPTTGGVQPLTSCMIANVPANSNLTVVVDPGMMSNCLVSGTPTAPGSSTTVSLTATDSAVAPSSPGTATSLNNSVTINSPLVIVSPARQINGLVGFPYTGATFTATGGTGNGTGLTWTQGGSVSASGLCAPAAPAPPGGIMLGGTTGTLTAATITLPAVKTTFLVCVEDTTTASTMAAAAAINVSATISVFDRKAFAGGDGGLSTLEIINTRTNLFSTSISLAGGTALPFGVAVTSDGSTVFVADNANNTIIGIDTITNAAITGSPFALPAGCGSPTELATTPDPVMAGHDRLYVVCTDTIGAHVEEVAVFDTTSSATLTAGAIAQVVTGVGSSPKAVTIQADNSLAYVTLNGLDQLAVIDNTGAPAQVGGSPYNLDATTDQPTGIALATNGASLYAYIGKQGVVAGTQQGIEVEDVTSAATSITLVTDILLTSGVTFNPDVVAVDPAGAFVYVTLSTGQQFDVVDNTVVTPVLIAGAPFGLPDPAGAANDIPGGVTIPPVPSGTPLAYITGIDIAPPADEVAVINDLNPPTANGASPIAVTAGSGPGRIASIPIPK